MEHQPQHLIILVVEDDPRVRDLLQDVLSDEGYAVIAATNGEEALATFATVRPHLMTLDLDLPGIIGELLLKELRQRDDTRDLPIVIISAKHPIPAAVRTLAQAVVPKPFDIDTLISIIRNIIAPPIEAIPP
jgi:two-component system phosphate regulon response regulator PhoB